MAMSSDGREWLLPTLFDASLFYSQSRPRAALFSLGRPVLGNVGRRSTLHHFVTMILLRCCGQARVPQPRPIRAAAHEFDPMPPAGRRAVEPNPKRRRTDGKEPISFGKAYAQSDTFRTLFKEGMKLVEETADYLDGPGRTAAKKLPRPASIVYATESMRLTTRLMQLASWLLLHRSVREGDMTAGRAREEKRKIRIEALSTNMGGPGWAELPEEFRKLVARSLNLQKRVERIDAALLEENPPEASVNAVNVQLKELAAALRAE